VGRLSTLASLADLATKLGERDLADEARALAERGAEGRFYVACVGQFKRGKSTLVNALLGGEVLPTGVTPVTSVVTVVRYGPAAARVRAAGGAWADVRLDDLRAFLTEEGNPSNRRGIVAAEVFAPSPLLASGMCLVDTPGLGSVFEANSESTRELVPHIDAVLAVVGADPPITGDELRLVEKLAPQVRDIVLVLNKADRISAQDATEAADFAARVAREAIGRDVGPIYRVSALEQLSGMSARRDWCALADRLHDITDRSGRQLVSAAVRRGEARLTDRLDVVMAERERTLREPLAESERRLAELVRRREESARALTQLGPLLGDEERRLVASFAERRAAYLEAAIPRGEQRLAEALARERQHTGARPRRARAFALAQEIVREEVAPWLEESGRAAAEAYRTLSQRFIGHIARMLAERSSNGGQPAEGVVERLTIAAELGGVVRFRFHDFHRLAAPVGLVPVAHRLAELVLPPAVAGTTERQARLFLRRLLETNAARVESDLAERVAESRRLLERELKAAIAAAADEMARAIEESRRVRAAGAPAVSAALAKLASQRAELASLVASAVSSAGDLVDEGVELR